MKTTTIQIVLDEDLLKQIDRRARKEKKNRSELIRDLVRQQLRAIRIRELEEKDAEGYRRFPPVEFEGWDKVQAWPDD